MKTLIIYLWLSCLDLSDLCSKGGYNNKNPQFGPGCMYRCHCVDDEQCDNITGTCPRGCAAGWMGPGCQYGDVAHTKQVRYLLNGNDLLINERNATDGQPTTCIGPTTWVEIDLNATYVISGLVINWGDASSTKSYEVRVGNYSNAPHSDVDQICLKQNNTQETDASTSVVCTTDIVGRYLLIKILDNATKITLCDVRVYGGRNLAYRHNASQSTTINTDCCGYAEASRAVDGNTNTMFNSKSCTHTTDTIMSPWWRINLEAVYDITRVVLYGRSDTCCTGRLSGFSVSFATNSSFNMVFKYPNTAPPIPTEVITLSGDYTQQVQIGLNKIEALTLCEVFVFGDCPKNLCGWTCDMSCYCKGPDDKQNIILANCPYGCKTGWWGYSCNQICDKNCIGNTCNQSDGYCLECLQGKWGTFCEKNCTNCFNGTECNIFNGICAVGCLTGFYGNNCTNQCAGQCAEDRSCNRSTGACIHSCLPGWKGENCSIACPPSFYGDDCSDVCGQCVNQTCNHINGTCPMGCSDGYNGTTCSERIQQEILPPRSSASFPIGATVGGILGAVVVIVIISLTIVLTKRRKSAHQRKRCQSKEPDANSDRHPTYENFNLSAEGERQQEIPAKEAETSGAKSKLNTHMNETACIEMNSRSNSNRTLECNADTTDDNSYYNLGKYTQIGGKKIAIHDLSDYVTDGVYLSNDIEDEFVKLLTGPQHEMNIALDPKNRHKNRYKGMYAYDKNRVILELLPNESDTDYINASFINGYKRDKAYIAAQGTIAATINDFWKMIWQYDVQQIVMLTGLLEEGKHKCLQYWPNEGECEYGMIKVKLIDEDICTEFAMRTLLISKTFSGKQKLVNQFHFTTWPDKRVPETPFSLVQFWKKVRHSRNSFDSPILVHCSAGIGRTGTYIALDYIFDEGNEEGYVNIFESVNTLRCQRIGLVQTAEQYAYLHEVVLEAFRDTGGYISADDFQNFYTNMGDIEPGTKSSKLLAEFEKLREGEGVYFRRAGKRKRTSRTSEMKDEFLEGKLSENKLKNRCSNILPSERYRPYLSTYIKGHTDYINAVCVPTRKNPKGFIVTQMPLPDTVIDFLRLVYEYEVQSIVMLNETNTPGEEIGVYWSEKNESSRHGPFLVKIASCVAKGCHIERMLEVSKDGEEQTLSLKQFICTAWKSNESFPNNIDGFLNLIDDVEAWKRRSGERPILVHCMNGAERSGLFCVIWCVLEKLKSDREVAIGSIIRQMRIRRHHFIPNFEQYKFCHDLIFFSQTKSTTYMNM